MAPIGGLAGAILVESSEPDRRLAHTLWKGQPTVRDISVVMCAYTEARWDDLVGAVESLRRQTLPPREIIVVIDHNPHLLARVRREIEGVVAAENQEGRGLSGGRNSGLRLARGQIVAFLDEDAVAAPDWLALLSMGYVDPRVAGSGGAIVPHWLGGRPAWFPEEFDWVVGCTYRGMPQQTAAVRNLIGCNMSFCRATLGTGAAFRPGIGRIGTRPVGCEETELCIRLRQRDPGSLFLYEPRARVYHRVPIARARLRYFLSRCYAEGLSKATVSRLVGARDGLASERFYVLRMLPRGVARYLCDAFLRRDPAGIARAAAIALGLATTAMGYLAGTVTERLSQRGHATQDMKTIAGDARS